MGAACPGGRVTPTDNVTPHSEITCRPHTGSEGPVTSSGGGQRQQPCVPPTEGMMRRHDRRSRDPKWAIATCKPRGEGPRWKAGLHRLGHAGDPGFPRGERRRNREPRLLLSRPDARLSRPNKLSIRVGRGCCGVSPAERQERDGLVATVDCNPNRLVSAGIGRDTALLGLRPLNRHGRSPDIVRVPSTPRKHLITGASPDMRGETQEASATNGSACGY